MSDRESPVEIHASAVVEQGADLGPGVVVGPLSYVEAGTRIGADSVLGSRVSVLRHTTIGKGCQVHSGAVLGDVAQDLAYGGEETYVEIGDRCVLRECVTVHRGTTPGSTTRVGDDCMLMACSHVAHNCEVGNDVIMANGALLGGHVQVGDRVFVGGGAAIHQFVRLGRLAMISGNCGITRDVPPFCITRELSTGVMGLNVVGMRRAGIDPEDRRQLKLAFKRLYRSGLNTSQALERIVAEIDNELVTELCDFVRDSKRGVARWAGSD